MLAIRKKHQAASPGDSVRNSETPPPENGAQPAKSDKQTTPVAEHAPTPPSPNNTQAAANVDGEQEECKDDIAF